MNAWTDQDGWELAASDAKVVDDSEEADEVDEADEAVAQLMNRGASAPKITVYENGLKYLVSPVLGQKSGFYCDQRENRRSQGRIQGRGVILVPWSGERGVCNVI